MSYNYLLELYRAIDRRIETIAAIAEPNALLIGQERHRQGRLDCLTSFRDFLIGNYHHRLPRRLRQLSFPPEKEE